MLFIIGFGLWSSVVCGSVLNPNSIDAFQSEVTRAVHLARSLRWKEAEDVVKRILTAEPNHFDANQVYGKIKRYLILRSSFTLARHLCDTASILMDSKKYDESIAHFEKAFSIRIPTELELFRNYLEALRLSDRIELGRANAARILQLTENLPRKPSDAAFFVTYSRLEQTAGNWEQAIQLAESAVNLAPDNDFSWNHLIDLLSASGNNAIAENVARQFIQRFGASVDSLCRLGMTVQLQKRLEEALAIYKEAEKLSPKSSQVLSCIAAAYQELGIATEAYFYYQQAIPLLPNQAAVRNNFGALLGSMGFQEQELYWLEEALRLDPLMTQVSINLAGHYQDDGEIDKAIQFLRKLPQTGAEYRNIDIRIATMLSPIPISWENMVQERLAMRDRLLAILAAPPVVGSCDTLLDHLHFYVSFHGLNDRPLQELVGKVYAYRLKEAGIHSPMIMRPNNAVQRLLTREERPVSSTLTTEAIYGRKVRIGFISKFFGIFEPHGMLLDGIMKYLPRAQFHVVCFFVARTDLKVVAPNIRDACDEQHQLSLAHSHALEFLQTMELDGLLFADVISEPIAHFLTHARLAPLQFAFWGNPLTTGSPTIDYFLSADHMEHPFRTRLPRGEDAYKEQVWLMDGQAIWYFRPIDPDVEVAKANMSHLVGKSVTYTRADHQLPAKESGVFLYILPQSTFKIHPLYDLVLREILAADPRIHIAVTGGRRPAWTAKYLHRLRYNLGPVYASRLHVIERVSSENFYSLLRLADGVLHPFPFDGSRTSADTLLVHVPFVTLPTEYLRGRMGYSFYRTMNISELVAVDVQDYIDIAVRLVQDRPFYQTMQRSIAERVDLIWEDMTVPFQATQFFQRVFGLPVSRSYEQYLLHESGRRAAHEPVTTVQEDWQRSLLRQQWQEAFDTTWGVRSAQRRQYTHRLLTQQTSTLTSVTGHWLLDEETLYATLEDATSLRPGQWPRLFQHWRRLRMAERRPLYEPPLSGMTPAPSISTNRNSSEFDPFPLRVGPKSKEIAGPGEQAVRQPPLQSSPQQQSQRLTEATAAATTKPLEVHAEYTPSPLVPTEPAVIDLSTTSTNTKQSISRDTVADQGTRFYDYGVIVTDAVSQEMVQQLQRFRDFVRRGKYRQAVDLLTSLESQGYPLPTENAVLNIERGTVHLHLGDTIEAQRYCQRAYQQNASMVNALGCMGVALTYASDMESKREASRVLYIALQKHIEALVLSLQQLHTEHPEIMDENVLVDMIDEETWSGSADSVVSLPLESLLFNYLASLVNLQEYDRCVETVVSFFKLPPAAQGGSHAVIMAQIQWSDIGVRIVEDLFPREVGLLRHAQRLRDRAPLLLSNMGICLTASTTYAAAYKAAFEDVAEVIERVHREQTLRAQAASSSSSPLASNTMTTTTTPAITSITLITQYFRASSKDAQQALDNVLSRNLANPAIDEVHLLTEEDMWPQLRSLFGSHQLQKIRQVVIGRRLTFSAAFHYANTELRGRLVALVNADIYFDESLYRVLYAARYHRAEASAFDTVRLMDNTADVKSWIPHQFPNNTVLALLRWQHDTAGTISLTLRTDSQDAWLFQSPVPEVLVSASDFPLGVPRCDNRLAYLFHRLGYRILNPAFDVHAIEYQTSTSELREGLYDIKNSVPGDVRNVLIDDSLHL